MKSQSSCTPDYRQWISLIDGNRALIRPATGADKDALLALFKRCSDETRFLRFHYIKPRLNEEELDRYCSADFYQTLAMVAEMERSGSTEIVGLAIYYRLPSPDTAEAAFMVEDREQGKGIGTHLLNNLAIMARERGVKTFVAELLNENVVMLDIFRKYAPQIREALDGNSIHVTFPA